MDGLNKIEFVLQLALVLAKVFGKKPPTKKEIADAIANSDTSALDALYGELFKPKDNG